jgi:hypothetical protein
MSAISGDVVLDLTEQVRAAAAADCAGTVDPALRWVLDQAVAGRHLPMNPATEAALRQILRELNTAA